MNRIQIRMGQAGVGLKELIATIVVAGVLLIVGVVIFAKVRNAMGYDYNSSVNATNDAPTVSIYNVETTAYDAFELATVALIVLAAAVIIGILIRAFGA